MWLVAVESLAVVMVLRDAGTAAAIPDMMSAGGHSAWRIALVLAVVGIAQAELDKTALRRERARFDQVFSFSFLSTWIFAAATLLPPALFVPAIAVVHYHTWWRVTRIKLPLYKSTFNLAKTMLAAYAVHAVVSSLGAGSPVALIQPGHALSALPLWLVTGLSVVPVAVPAIVAYAVVDQSLVTIMILLADPGRTRTEILGSRSDNMVEIAIIGMGALIAVVAVFVPELLSLSLGPVWLAQRAAVAHRLQHAATIDSKTSLLTYTEWMFQAGALLVQPRSWWRTVQLAGLAGRFGRPRSAEGDAQSDGTAPRRTKGLQVGGGSRRRGSERPGDPIGLFMLDLDHFKELNATYGHPGADAVLQEVARRLRASVRAHDLVGRFGGDELVVLVRGSQAGPRSANARHHTMDVTAERILRQISGRISIDTPDGPLTVRPVTMSIGAVVLEHGCTVDRLPAAVDAADRALYAAKRAGRNCVRFGELRRAGGVDPAAETIPHDQIHPADAPTIPLPVLRGVLPAEAPRPGRGLGRHAAGG